MRIHFCPFDRTCRRAGAPWRICLFTRHWTYQLALRPGDRFVQRWTPDGYRDGTFWTWREPLSQEDD